jgi:hypothetical protein
MTDDLFWPRQLKRAEKRRRTLRRTNRDLEREPRLADAIRARNDDEVALLKPAEEIIQRRDTTWHTGNHTSGTSIQDLH